MIQSTIRFAARSATFVLAVLDTVNAFPRRRTGWPKPTVSPSDVANRNPKITNKRSREQFRSGTQLAVC
jgi:hypothetical protein